MKTLCVYCSRSGNTKQISETISRELDAELVELTDGKSRKGFFGYVSGVMDGWRTELLPLLPFETQYPLYEYQRIILAAPIWCDDLCPVARSFLQEHASELKGEIHVVLTHMDDRSFENMVSKAFEPYELHVTSILSVRTWKNDPTEEINEFIERLK